MRKGDAPVIVFSKGAAHALADIAAIGADVVGLDWTVDIAAARSLTGTAWRCRGTWIRRFCTPPRRAYGKRSGRS